jgi:endoglucanase
MGNNLHCLREPAITITPDASHMYEMNFRTGPVLTRTEDISFPLSTFGSKIVDRSGRRVKLACVNWSGAHMCRHTVSGLEFRKLADMCREVRSWGFNGIRLTFSLQLFFKNPVIPEKYLTANPELLGLRAMDIFDRTVQEMTRAGLMVILNNHTSSSMWCCSNDDQEGLWWTAEYPEYKWMDCLRNFAHRYKNNPLVIGFDLRNEIRKTPELTPSWGDGNILTDWRRAAVDAGN